MDLNINEKVNVIDQMHSISFFPKKMQSISFFVYN